ncbi:MAG: cytochrome c [Candidatus Acidiferrales bacterium]
MKFLIGILVGVILTGAAIVAYFWFGFAPVAVADKPMPFERTIADRALDAHIARQPIKDSPLVESEANVVSGAYLYGMYCAGCHGLPDKPKGALAGAMFPSPPQFFAHAGGHGGHPIGEDYWKVANGIRLSGMPSFQNILSESELWQVCELLEHKNALPDAAKSALASTDSAPSK